MEDKFNILGDVTISEVRVLAGASWWTLTSSRALNVERFQNTSCQVRVPVSYSCSVIQTPHYHPPIHPNVKASVVVTYTWKHPWPADLTVFKHLGQAEAAQLNCGSEEKKLSSDSFFSLLATNLSCVLGCSLRTFGGSTRFMNTFGPDHSHRCCQATTFPKTWTVAQTCNPKKKKNQKKQQKHRGASHSLTCHLDFLPK